MKLDEYLGAQCCSWVKRAYSMDELWKKELFFLSGGNLFNLREKDFNKELNPILHNIARYFEKFVFKFTVIKENFRKAYIFDNPCIKFDVNSPHFLKKTFFTNEEWQMHAVKIKNLTMDMLMSNDNVTYSKEYFENKCGMSVSLLKLNKLRGMALTSVRLYGKFSALDKKTDTVQNFLMRTKRGSKRIRNVLGDGEIGIVSPNILKFAELTEIVINSEESRFLNQCWSFGYLTNSTKVFLFKLHNNLLGLNSRVAHFVRGHPATCTFCDISNEPEEHRESTVHLFFECRHVENLLAEFFSWVFQTNEPRYVSRSEFFAGFRTEIPKKDRALNVVAILVKKFIWECKLRFCIPTLQELKKNVIAELKRIASVQYRMRDLFIQSELFDLQF